MRTLGPRISERSDGYVGLVFGICHRSFSCFVATESVARALLLPGKHLRQALSVRKKASLVAPGPRFAHLGARDVPVGSALSQYGAKILAQFFRRGSPEKPVAHVDLVDD